MIGVVVASHGGLCRELLITAEMILGPATQTAAAPLAAGTSLQDFAGRVAADCDSGTTGSGGVATGRLSGWHALQCCRRASGAKRRNKRS